MVFIGALPASLGKERLRTPLQEPKPWSVQGLGAVSRVKQIRTSQRRQVIQRLCKYFARYHPSLQQEFSLPDAARFVDVWMAMRAPSGRMYLSIIQQWCQRTLAHVVRLYSGSPDFQRRFRASVMTVTENRLLRKPHRAHRVCVVIYRESPRVLRTKKLEFLRAQLAFVVAAHTLPPWDPDLRETTRALDAARTLFED